MADSLHGTLALVLVPKSGAYIVIGVDSRRVDERGMHYDDACKAIALSPQALFFTVGNEDVKPALEPNWSATDTARRAYSARGRGGPYSVADSWRDKTVAWYSHLSPTFLNILKGSDESLVTGGFIRFEDGSPSIQIFRIYFAGSPPRVSSGTIETVHNGDIRMFGSGSQLALEFINGQTARSRGRARFGDPGIDPDEDLRLLKAATDFTADNLTGSDSGTVGGPVDTAVLLPNARIRWTARKHTCYAQDGDFKRTKRRNAGTNKR